MTKRKDPADLKIRARDDLTPKPRIRRGVSANKEVHNKRLDNLFDHGSRNELIEQANPDRVLTEKQKLFVSFWAQGESILSASYKAGYADGGTMAYRLSKDPAILKIYHYEKAKYEEAAQVTRKEVIDGFREAANMARIQADPVALTGAFREIGKMCGYYEPVKRTIDINVKGNVTMKKLEALGNDELLKLIKGEVEDVAFKEVDDEDDKDEQP